MEAVYQYVEALQAAIQTGATVCIEVQNLYVKVLSVGVREDGLSIGYVPFHHFTLPAPPQQWVLVPLATVFMAVFDSE